MYSVCALFVLIYCILNIHGISRNFEAYVKNMTYCSNPHPPFAEKPGIIPKFNICKRKEKTYISGTHSVLEDTPFLNLSVSTYSPGTHGKEDLQVIIESVSCHNWLSRLYLTVAKMRYSKKDCKVRKGTYSFENVDVNAIFHSIPNFHDIGTVLHKVILVHNGSTVFCHELKLSIVDI